MDVVDLKKSVLTKPNWEFDDKKEDESLQSLRGFRLRPRLRDAFNERQVKAVMQEVHSNHLDGKSWADLDAKITCSNIAQEVKNGVKNICHSTREDSR